MPPVPLIDSHVHLWDPKHLRLQWLDKNKLLNRRYCVPEFREHTAGVEIEAFVYVETGCDPAYGQIEARWAAALAKEEPKLRGIVAWAPLEHGDPVRSYLAALKEISPLIKGVRRIAQGEADPQFSSKPDFIKGAQHLAEFGFSCDICINPKQLGGAIELVRQCPKVNFVLDHIAKPNIKEHVLDPWRAQLKELAALPNVVCKMSGLVTEADPQWTSADLKPYVEHVLDCFGEDRVAFGSDWPVTLLASKYDRWVKTLDELTAGLSAAAKKKLWAENARAFYRLGKA